MILSNKSIFSVLVLATVFFAGVSTSAHANAEKSQRNEVVQDHKNLIENTSLQTKQILFIDSAVEDQQTLLNGINSDVEVITLDAQHDGLVQMAEVLRSRSGIDAVHIVSHGQPGTLQLGSSKIDQVRLDDYSNELATISEALATNGDILLYGCDVAQGTVGDHFINRIAQLTGVSVAASIDATGTQALGGNWALEKKTGHILADNILSAQAMSGYGHLLVLPANGVKDVTPSTLPGSFIPGFTLTKNTSGTTIFTDDPLGIYFYDISNTAAAATFTVAADGTNLGTFDLTGFTSPYFTGASDTLTVTFSANGGATTTSGTVSTANGGALSGANFAAFTGISSFSFTVTAGTSTGNLTWDSFTIANAVAPGVNDSDGTLTAAGGVIEPVNLPTTALVGSPVSVFDFTIADGGGGDGFTLDVSQIDIPLSGTSSGNFSKMRFNLSGCATQSAVQPTGSTLSFTATGISVADAGSATCTVAAYWAGNTGITDNQTLTMLIDGDVNLTVDPAKTQMSGTNTLLFTNMATTVSATKLIYTTQPAGSVSGVALSTQPIVKAVDAAGNVDADYVTGVTLTEVSAGALTGGSFTPVAGVASFTSVNYSASADQETFILTASSGALSTAASNVVTSDVVATKLLYTTQPAPTSVPSGVATAFSIVPVVSAVNANNIVDTGYTTNFVLSEVNGAGAAIIEATGDSDGAGNATVTLTPTAGVRTFTGLSVNYTVSGGSNETFNLRASSGGLTIADSTLITGTIDVTPPTVTDGNISISGASGTSGAYKVGDTVTASWNNTAGGDNNNDINTVTVDFSQFGGGAAVAASNTTNTWSATFTITEDGGGSIDATNRNVSVTATDNAGNGTTTADTTNATVDNDSPVVTAGNISLSAGSGTSGAYKVGDTVTATWNNTGAGDNNTDISSASVDFSQFGGGAAVVASNSGGTWTASFTVTEDGGGSIDAVNRNVSVTATDNAGNGTTTADTTNAIVDNDSPVVTNTNISLNTGSGTAGTFIVGDTITATWNNTAGGENNSDTIASVNVDFSAFGGSANVTATNNAGNWSADYIVTEVGGGSIDTTSLNVSVTVVDNAGNSITTADTSNGALDNTSPGSATGTLAVDENSINTTPVGTVTGGGADGISYSLFDNAGGRFAITAGGNVTVANGSLLNREASASHDITVRATDNAGNTTDAILSVTINDVNEVPTINLDLDNSSTAGGNNYATSFSADGAAVVIADSDAVLADVDVGAQIATLTATLTARPDGNGAESLSLNAAATSAASGLTVSYTTITGVLSISGTATPTIYQSVLRGIQYNNGKSVANITAGDRTVDVVANDGTGNSATATTTLTVVTAPVVDLGGNGGSPDLSGTYTEGDNAVSVVTGATIEEPDGDNLNQLQIILTNAQDGASESVTLNGRASGNVVNGITITYNSATQITLSGSASAINYQALLNELQYSNSSENPDTTDRSITVQGRDTGNNSGAIATLTLSITAVNDPLTGNVVITGGSTPPIEGETLGVDVSNIGDIDGLGAFGYQWNRGGSAISGEINDIYNLVSADIGSTITVTVSYTDLGGTPESTTSVATAAVDGDLDGDGTGDLTDPDIDGDGMSNVYEDANGLNKLDANDRDTDLDGDGVSNYDESVADSNANADDYPPVVTPPADVTVDATGLFTEVDPGVATASDIVGGNPAAVTVTSDAPSHFAPGVNTVTWSATDAAGNTGTATQFVNVTPLVNLSIDQTAREGDTITIKAILNGDAVTYPVTVPYTVSGTADGSDHDLVDDSISITASNLEASMTIDLADDGAGEGDETLIVTMGTPTNAVKGSSDVHTTTISENNLVPQVELAADQGSVTTTSLVTQTDGSVTVTATVSDSVGDTHSYDWSLTDNALSDTDGLGNSTFSFDPSGLQAGIYTLRVAVTDNNSGSSDADLILNVVASAPVLTNADTDGDGFNDDTEGHGDSDNDGIPNYLDHSTLSNNVVPGRSATANQFLMETEAGLKVRVGKVAFRAGKDGINVNMDDVTTHANDGAGATADNRHDYDSGMFDFEIHKLPAAGQSIRVVLAQQATIPANAVYRKYANGVWQQFVEDDNNSVASATGVEGYCPPPGDVAYTAELTEGDWCVQITIEDGGPNDADGKANRSISDPGGVTESVSSSGHDNNSILDDLRDAAGSANPLWLLMILGLLPLRRKELGANRKKH